MLGCGKGLIILLFDFFFWYVRQRGEASEIKRGRRDERDELYLYIMIYIQLICI